MRIDDASLVRSEKFSAIARLSGAATLLFIVGCGGEPPADVRVSPDAGADAAPPTPPETGPCQGVPTTGRCLGTSTIQSCLVSHLDDDPEVVEIECAAGLGCVEEVGGARCKPSGDCSEGAAECLDETTLRRCENGAWIESVCAECVGGASGASCLAQAPSSSGIFVSGSVRYEALRPQADHEAYDPIPVKLPAAGTFVGVADGAPDYETWLGWGFTDETGKFSFELEQAPSSDALIGVMPIELSPAQDYALTVLVPESSALLYQRTRDVWQYVYYLCDGPADCASTAIDLGTLDISLNDGSGAMHIFQVLRRGRAHVRSIFPKLPQPTLAVFWSDEIEWSCGDCYLGPNYGGATYATSPTQVEHWDSSILISGGLLRPSHWSDSFILHELGHWVLENYSLSPTEGGVHKFFEPNTPGMAFREGWPTFFGQAVLSAGGEPNPIVFWQHDGKAHTLDLELVELDGQPIPLPNPTGQIDQPVAEAVVGSILWSLWANANALEPQALGDGPMYGALRSKRMLFGPDRGYTGSDLVDYLDSLFCTGVDAESVATSASSLNYPWKVGEAACP